MRYLLLGLVITVAISACATNVSPPTLDPNHPASPDAAAGPLAAEKLGPLTENPFHAKSPQPDHQGDEHGHH